MFVIIRTSLFLNTPLSLPNSPQNHPPRRVLKMADTISYHLVICPLSTDGGWTRVQACVKLHQLINFRFNWVPFIYLPIAARHASLVRRRNNLIPSSRRWQKYNYADAKEYKRKDLQTYTKKHNKIDTTLRKKTYNDKCNHTTSEISFIEKKKRKIKN